MKPESTNPVPDRSAEPPASEPPSAVHWQQIGRRALRLDGRSAEPLQDTLDQCAALVVYEHWLANGRNLTKTAEVLDISRKRARTYLAAYRRALTLSKEGGQ